jgi:hypothetical protein
MSAAGIVVVKTSAHDRNAGGACQISILVNAQEENMEKDKKSAEDLSTIAGQTVQQARMAMENYLNFFQKNMSASPWASTELNKKVTDYAQQNVDSAFGFAQKLTQAKDLQDLVRIQTEFFQTQLKSLTEQAKDLSDTATKAVAGASKGPFTSSS